MGLRGHPLSLKAPKLEAHSTEDFPGSNVTYRGGDQYVHILESTRVVGPIRRRVRRIQRAPKAERWRYPACIRHLDREERQDS